MPTRLQERLSDGTDAIGHRFNFPPPDENRTIKGSKELAEAIAKLTRSALLPTAEAVKDCIDWTNEPEPELATSEPPKSSGEGAYAYAANLAARMRAGIGRVKDFIGGYSFDDVRIEEIELEMEEEEEDAEEEAEADEDDEEEEEIFGVKASAITAVPRLPVRRVAAPAGRP